MVLILVVNCLGVLILFPWWFFAFDLYAGLNWQAFTFGLPLLAGIVFLVLDTVYMFRNKRRRRGLRGTGIATASAVCNALIIWFFAAYIIGIPIGHSQAQYETEEDKVLALVLKTEFGDSLNYAIVEPDYSNRYFRNIYELKASITSQLLNAYGDYFSSSGISDDTIAELVDRFVEINISPGKLTILSSLDGGYYIDFAEKMNHFFSNSWGPGWFGWRLSHPRVMPSVDVSRPVYDQGSGIVIVYIGWQGDYLCGSGKIFVYKYENDEILKYLYSIPLWVS